MDQLEKRFQVSLWIAEELSGGITDEHKAMLDDWREEAVEHETEYRELIEDFQSGQERPSLDEKEMTLQQWKKFVNMRSFHQFGFRRWMRYAAIFILIVGISGIIYRQLEKTVVEVIPEQIEIAQGDVMLILSNGKKVAIGTDTVRILQDESQAKIQVSGNTICYTEKSLQPTGDVYNTLVIPKGGEYKIVLADGTQVWLNAETEFRYPLHFTEERRRVYLKGEAYFEVARNKEKPFIVVTSGGVDVKVLGTCFNVASYEEDAEVVTTLVEGSVEVHTFEDTLRIQPDEQVLFNKKLRSLSRKQVDARISMAWKDGNFIFENEPLEHIMKQLQRWYQMDVFYTNEAVKNYCFTGDLRKYDHFGKIVKMIEEVAGLQISVKDKCVIIGMK